MRFLSVNHLRLGSAPAGIPAHSGTKASAFSTASVWQRAVNLAIRENVHAVLLSGEIISPRNTGLEPWGPLLDGLTELHRAGIPTIAVENGEFSTANLARFTTIESVHWLTDTLDWDPAFTTNITPRDTPTVHVFAGSLAESNNAPAKNPVTLEQIDHPDSIWILTVPLQPDQIDAEHALVIEPGSTSPLAPSETGTHGAWLIDTDIREARLLSLANIEFASVDIDISSADDLDTLERLITSGLVAAADAARNHGSIAEVLVVDATLTGNSRLYPALADTADELQRMLQIEHQGMSITLDNVAIDAAPQIDLGPLLNRPDPVGEIARLINALDTGDALTETQSRLVHSTEQQVLAVTHARVFGSILDFEPELDAATLLRRQGWATLDALVRQRGID